MKNTNQHFFPVYLAFLIFFAAFFLFISNAPFKFNSDTWNFFRDALCFSIYVFLLTIWLHALFFLNRFFS